MKLDVKNLDLKTDSLKGPLKRVALFHDVSGFGKASLTTALPILSAAGLEGCCIPTAILSTHTGEFDHFTFRDLTEDLEDYLNHWEEFGLTHDAIYSGYLGSPEQAKILSDYIDKQKERNPELIAYIDPVMGDNGKLYTNYGQEMVDAMKKLVKKADIVLPNLTEATALLGLEYKEGPYTKEYLEEIIKGLHELGPEKVIITGINLNEEEIGTVLSDGSSFKIVTIPRVAGKFHGTGDTFASFLLSFLLNNYTLEEAVNNAAVLTYGAAKRTESRKTPRREGIDFEGMLPLLVKTLDEDKKI